VTDPVTTDIAVIEGGGKDSAIVRQVYVPPLDGKSDDYEGFDMRVAKGIGELLNKHYFGYSWKSFADTKQGVVGFSIPELMGETLHYVINLKQFSDLTPELIVRYAGELLERMHLPRDKFDMAALKLAKANRANFHFDDKRIQ
jgi:hypothetical protein